MWAFIDTVVKFSYFWTSKALYNNCRNGRRRREWVKVVRKYNFLPDFLIKEKLFIFLCFLLLLSSHLQCTLKIKKELIKGLFVNDKMKKVHFIFHYCCCCCLISFFVKNIMLQFIAKKHRNRCWLIEIV